jgi:hypothetical protein
MIKSNHSNTLPIDAAATARQRTPSPGCAGERAARNSVNAIPKHALDLNKDDPDGCWSNRHPLQAADRLSHHQHGKRAEDGAALAQAREQAERARAPARRRPRLPAPLRPPTAKLPPPKRIQDRLSTTSAKPSTHAPAAFIHGPITALTTTYASSEICARVSLQHGLRESNAANACGRNPRPCTDAGRPTTGRRMLHRLALANTLPRCKSQRARGRSLRRSDMHPQSRQRRPQ